VPPPTTRITLAELQKLAAEVFDVSEHAVTSPFHDHTAIHLGALWSAPLGPHVEYRSIDIALRGIRDEGGSSTGAHAFNVAFDALEGILRRRSAARAHDPMPAVTQRELAQRDASGPPSSIRPRLEPVFTEALPSAPPESDDDA
jgi:hypothetical protein